MTPNEGKSSIGAVTTKKGGQNGQKAGGERVEDGHRRDCAFRHSCDSRLVGWLR